MSRPLEAKFYDPERKRWNTYDFEIVGLDHTIAQDLKDAFVELVGHYHPRSRIQAWRSTRLLCSCIVERKISFEDDCKDILAGYALFLDSGKRLKKTIGSHYNFARRLVDWLSGVSESIFWKRQVIQLFDFTRERKNNRDNDVSYKDLQRIVSVCKKEIAGVTKDFAVSRAIGKGEAVSHPDLTAEDIEVISVLIGAAKENAWTRAEIRAKIGRTINLISLKKFRHYRELTYRAALPIYILLLVEMAANPVALMEIEATCYDTDPADETRAFIRWEKGRSGREQQLSFLNAGKYSAPSLIELVLTLTETTRHLAQPGDERLLFLIRTGHVARRFCVQSLHNYLSDFRDLYGFPYFNFSDLRKAVSAFIKNKKTAKDAKNHLQHKDIATTNRFYLNGKQAQQDSYEKVAAYQGELITAVLADETDGQSRYSTLFGFSCHGAKEGRAPNSVRGEDCLEFLSCATCPNALVVVDDPRFVARIIKSQMALEKMERECQLSADQIMRFESVFRPILSIISEQIVPRISRKVIDRAERMLDQLPELPMVY
ncbi:hypothetical protein HXW87_02690 [Pseudomonas sp. Y5-11]|jgi:hypothetical protein|uniref:hypothetical protein n=1 Tax=Pseudomonas TaxID=286 RepID=UPI00103D653D|nr:MULTISPECIES: hypothetical protein [Pseudomonas]QXE12587.1 hypothetical protein GTQ41_27295 [Pseudomonas sp. AN-B15]ULN81105.1 hypothetical protein HXW87_02690 [Pseudomonas sp. Y5-11]